MIGGLESLLRARTRRQARTHSCRSFWWAAAVLKTARDGAICSPVGTNVSEVIGRAIRKDRSEPYWRSAPASKPPFFRGDDLAFLSWFARTPGPAQIISVSDDRCVHSSAVVLQHLRRTPTEAAAITDAVYSWIGERIGQGAASIFPGLQPDVAHGTLHGRWPAAQDVLYALHLLAESVGTSPILERSEAITDQGIVELSPANAIAMTLGSEYAPHFRHRRTGWIVAVHGFRFGTYIGSGFADWLRRDFEPLVRTVADSQRDLAALADEVKARTGAVLLVQNLISSNIADRVSNYAWLGDSFDHSVPVRGTEANLMLSGLTRSHGIALIDSDALAAEIGVKHCPDRFHASRELVEAQRNEVHRVLRECKIRGF